MSFREAARKICSDERGQSTTEYILIMAVVVMMAMKFRSLFSRKITDMVNVLDTDIDRAMKGDGY